ncbi:MAG TPA: hypothetical protein VF111_14930 [Thermoanaerobaculia bacterium]
MTYQLRIIFDGIVVSGPSYPSQEGQKRKGPFYAVLPFTTRHLSRHAPDDAGPEWYIPAHTPVLFARDSLVPTGRTPDETYHACTPDGPTENAFNLWYPMRERMAFGFDGNSDSGEISYLHHDPQEYPGPGGAVWPDDKHRIHAVTKVPRMRDIFPRRDAVRAAALAKQARAIHAVASQVFVPIGQVSGGADRGDLKEYGIDAEFVPTRVHPPHCKKIVPQVVVTVPVRNSIEIAMVSLDTGKALDPIRFDIHGDEMIRIENSDPENIRYVLDHLLLDEADFRKPNPIRSKPIVDTLIRDVDFEALYAPLRGDDGQPMPVPAYGPPAGMRNCFGVMADKEATGCGCLPFFGR